MFEVKVELPNRPQDEPVEVQGVGLVKNYGSTVVDLTQEQADIINDSFGMTATSTNKQPEVIEPVQPEVIEAEVKEGGDGE